MMSWAWMPLRMQPPSMAAVKSVASALLPRVDTIHVDVRALGLCVLLAFVSTIAIGIVPALKAYRTPVAATLAPVS